MVAATRPRGAKPVMFNKYGLEMIERALGRTLLALQESDLITDTDPYLAKYKDLHTRVKQAAKDAPK